MSRVECRELILSRVECRELSLSGVECRELSLSRVECRELSVSRVECRELSLSGVNYLPILYRKFFCQISVCKVPPPLINFCNIFYCFCDFLSFF